MRRVNTGGLPFRDLRDCDKYYVDKTQLIMDILDMDERGIYLFTRPRRFGKTTNLTMLDAFFNIEYAGNDWFEGLRISHHPEYLAHMSRYPVVMIDLKDAVAVNGSYDMFISLMRSALREVALRFAYLMGSDRLLEVEKAELGRMMDRGMDEGELVTSVRDLCSMLERHHGTKVVLLMDEYDRGVTDAFGTDVMDRITAFMGAFLSSSLKGNRSLQMAYVTGVMQLAKTGMFSGLNNISVNSVLSKECDECFGFSEAEVRSVLGYYGRAECMDVVRTWYDGYRFGDTEVYNPFSLMTYISKGFVPGMYWISASGDMPLRWMLDRVGIDEIAPIANMLNGGSFRCRVHDSMTYSDPRSIDFTDMCSLMVLTGYLKAVPAGDGEYDLSIPNREVMGMVDSMMSGMLRADHGDIRAFGRAVMDGDAEAMAETLQRILRDASYFNLRDESSYELVLLTLMHDVLGEYRVKSQVESGNGRADLILTPERDGLPPIVMELKLADSTDSLEAEAEGAIRQIAERGYHLGMGGRAILVGLAFCGKVPFAKVEVATNRA